MSQLNNPQKVELEFGGRTLSIESGRMAKQADGAVYVQYGDSSALVTVVSAKEQKAGYDFFPLTIEIQEKFYAAGKIPGGFFKREARPSEWATLNARMVDRPLRPLFPEGYKHETQIAVTLLSYDNENELECLAGLGASAALMVSDVPFTNPIATVRVARVDGTLKINPLPDDLEKSDINIIVSATEKALVMVEGGADFASEEDILDALYFGFDKIQELIALQKKLRELCGKERRSYTPPAKNEALNKQVSEAAQDLLKAAFAETEKHTRYEKLSEASKTVSEKILSSLSFTEDYTEDKAKGEIKTAFSEAKKTYARQYTVQQNKRIDGRDYDKVRKIETEISLLPRVHGSALFTRGETQALVVTTLGTSDDEQLLDSVRGRYNDKFMLHYNFPPYSVGETGRFGGMSRREIGHGTLAKRAISAILPEPSKFPYTVRVVSEVFESNGSSSMATICGASMALMDAGVPVKEPVAGIAMGLIEEGGEVVVLSDILGDEDHLGDMDFKVAGSERGITALQMDIKMTGVSREILKKAMDQAKAGRLHILGEMKQSISNSKEELSEHAPRFYEIQVPEEKIRDVIGPGGKNIKNIMSTTGAKVDIEDSGLVRVAAADSDAAEKAIAMIKDLTAVPEVGKIYMGTVAKVAPYGCFVDFMPGTSGLCHISELDDGHVKQVEDICAEGDQIPVKVIGIDRMGKVKLSRKEAIEA